MHTKWINWLLFIALSLIWGSSFTLMKIGLDNHLSAYQVAAIRILSAGIVLLPVMLKCIRLIPVKQLWIILLSGALGSLLPAFLFCMAEERIDSSLAGMLNSLTPVFVILTGALFFKLAVARNKIVGILIALAGSFLLLLSNGHMQESRQLLYVSFVVLATISYGLNVNLVTKYLVQTNSLHITAVALCFNAIPALVILISTGYFSSPFRQPQFLLATGAAMLLGIVRTAIATVLFYMLVKRAGGIFASMVTYGIPFVAAGWGIVFGEAFGWQQLGCLLIILVGVYIVNKRPPTQ